MKFKTLAYILIMPSIFFCVFFNNIPLSIIISSLVISLEIQDALKNFFEFELKKIEISEKYREKEIWKHLNN